MCCFRFFSDSLKVVMLGVLLQKDFVGFCFSLVRCYFNDFGKLFFLVFVFNICFKRVVFVFFRIFRYFFVIVVIKRIVSCMVRCKFVFGDYRGGFFKVGIFVFDFCVVSFEIRSQRVKRRFVLDFILKLVRGKILVLYFYFVLIISRILFIIIVFVLL